MISWCLNFSAMMCLVAIVREVSSLPASIERCDAGDTECIRKTVELLIRDYAKTLYTGAKFPVLEPFELELPDTSVSKLGISSLKLRFTDQLFDGFSNLRIDRVVGFTSSSEFELYGSFAKLTLLGKFNADGRIANHPIQANGNSEITIVTSKFSVIFNRSSLNSENGKTSMRIAELSLQLELDNLLLEITELLNTPGDMEGTLNDISKQNPLNIWTDELSQLGGSLKESLKNLIDSLLRNFVNGVPPPF